jgi:hypothetical protein
MTRRLLAVLGVWATAFVLIARAETPFPVKVEGKKGTSAAGDQADPKIVIEDAANQQERLKRQFDDFKQALLRVAQRLEASTDPKDKEKAKNLKEAIKKASEQGVDTKFSTLVDALRKENTFQDLDQLQKVLQQNEELRRDLRAILEYLMRDDSENQRKREIAEKTRLLEEIKRLIAAQERVYAKNQTPRIDAKNVQGSQKKVTEETQRLLDPKAAKNNSGAEAKKGEGKDSKGREGIGEAKEDAKDPKGESHKAAEKDAKSGEGKDGKGAEGKDSKSGEGKDAKSGEGKEGKDSKEGEAKGGEGKDSKSGEGKDSKDGKGGEGKDGKGDAKSGEGKEGKPGEGKEGKDSKSGEGKDSKDGKGGEGKDSKGGESKDGKPGDGKAGNPKDGKPGEGKQGKPGEAKSNAGKPTGGQPGKPTSPKPTQVGKPGDGKPGAGKPGDRKAKSDGKGASKGGSGGESKPGEGKPGESKSGGKSGQQGENKGSQSQSGQQGQQGQQGEQGQQGQQGQQDQQPNNPVKKQIQDANHYQKQAEENLDKNKRPDAGEKMEKAKEELEKARKKLEDLLKQLREEEIERLLAQLEQRCKHMLALQIQVRDGTVELDKQIQATADKNPTRADQQTSLGLSEKEDEIVTEAKAALRLLEADGSAVAFAEVFQQLLTDMINVAGWLRKTDTGTVTVATENDIIATLKEMIEALQKARAENKSKQGKSPPPGQPPDPKLIDLIAELKMIRSMQIRVNKRTELYGNLYPTEQSPAVDKGKDAQEKKKLTEVHHEMKDLSGRQEKLSKITHDIATGKNEAK